MPIEIRQYCNRLLCVDDSSPRLDLVSRTLRSKGYEVNSCSNAKEALFLFQARRGDYDAILTNFEMPDIDGLQLVRALRSENYLGPVFVMSGNHALDIERKFTGLAVTQYLQKPFKINILVDALMQSTSNTPVVPPGS